MTLFQFYLPFLLFHCKEGFANDWHLVHLGSRAVSGSGLVIGRFGPIKPLLKDAGVDVIDLSSGGMAPEQKISLSPGYQVPFAETIRQEGNIKTAAVGLITEPHQAESILKEGKADFIALARELLRRPHWPLQAATDLGVDLPWLSQYEQDKPH